MMQRQSTIYSVQKKPVAKGYQLVSGSLAQLYCFIFVFSLSAVRPSVRPSVRLSVRPPFMILWLAFTPLGLAFRPIGWLSDPSDCPNVFRSLIIFSPVRYGRAWERRGA